jgi:hypothetical protein
MRHTVARTGQCWMEAESERRGPEGVGVDKISDFFKQVRAQAMRFRR